MGLFNSGKNEKVEKVSKYERHYNVPPKSSRRRSSKHPSHQGDPAMRAMSQPPLMRMGGGAGFYQAAPMFPPTMMGGMAPNLMNQLRYPISPYDLSKYPSNPFAGQIMPMNLPPVWNNGMPLLNHRSGFQQPFNDYQQGGWSIMQPSNYGYMPPMQF